MLKEFSKSFRVSPGQVSSIEDSHGILVEEWDFSADDMEYVESISREYSRYGTYMEDDDMD